jgi:hypothetical protein
MMAGNALGTIPFEHQFRIWITVLGMKQLWKGFCPGRRAWMPPSENILDKETMES